VAQSRGNPTIDIVPEKIFQLPRDILGNFGRHFPLSKVWFTNQPPAPATSPPLPLGPQWMGDELMN